MINLSASSIKDYLQCPWRFKYRIQNPELAIQTQEMVVGEIIHSVIESNWNDEEKGFLLADKLEKERSIDELGKRTILRCLRNFYDYHATYLLDSDDIEYNFKYRYSDEVNLVGKMDRILKNSNTIIDWKTGETFVASISSDIQFIMYYVVYRRLFGIEPSVYYINLSKNKMIPYKHNKRYEDELFLRIIPRMLDSIQTRSYAKEGYFNNACKNCSFIQDCWREE